jgi:hypothetical protein
MNEKFNFAEGVIVAREEGYCVNEVSVDLLYGVFEDLINGKTIDEMSHNHDEIAAVLSVAWSNLWRVSEDLKVMMKEQDDDEEA